MHGRMDNGQQSLVIISDGPHIRVAPRLSPDKIVAGALGVARPFHGLHAQWIQPSLSAMAIQSANDVMGHGRVARPHEYLTLEGIDAMVPREDNHRDNGRPFRDATAQRRDEVENPPLAPIPWPVHGRDTAGRIDNKVFRNLPDRHTDIDVGPDIVMDHILHLGQAAVWIQIANWLPTTMVH